MEMLMICMMVMVVSMLVSVAILRWALRINVIVGELQAIRKAVGGVVPTTMESHRITSWDTSA